MSTCHDDDAGIGSVLLTRDEAEFLAFMLEEAEEQISESPWSPELTNFIAQCKVLRTKLRGTK